MTPKASPDTYLEFNETTPFPGVLINQNRYKDLITGERSLIMINADPRQFIKSEGDPAPQFSIFSSSSILVKALYFLLGGIAGYEIAKGK